MTEKLKRKQEEKCIEKWAEVMFQEWLTTQRGNIN